MDVLNFFHVQYCVNICCCFFFQSKKCIYFLECHLCFLLYVMLPVFLSHDNKHTNSEGTKTKSTESDFDTSVELKLDAPLPASRVRYTLTAGGNLWQLGPVEMSPYFISRSCSIYDAHFYSSNQLNCQRGSFVRSILFCVRDVFGFIFLCCNTICHI